MTNIKKRVEVEEVPASTYENTFFDCGVCGQQFNDEDDAKGHWGKTHTVKKQTEVAGITWRWFDTEEDAKLYLDPPGFYSANDFTDVEWTGPGWYGETTTYGNGRCRCGGCHYTETGLHPVSRYESWARDEISKAQNAVTAAEKKLQDLTTLTPKES